MNNRPIYASAIAAAVSFASTTMLSPAIAAHHIASVAPVPTAKLAAPQLFVRGNTKLYNPDGIVITKNFVFVDWQGQSDHLPGPSTIVKYDLKGNIVGSVALNGRCDGLRLNPSTKQLWALFNNDGQNGSPKRQPLLYTIDPKTLTTSLYEFPAVQPHGGGYDDAAFINGQAYLSASSPTLNAQGINDKPAIVAATLANNGRVKITPVLYGNAKGYNANTKSFGALNISDPDSLAVDANNDLVLVGDNDQEVIVIKHPGQIGSQTVARYGYGTQFDDVAFSSGTSGTLWIADDTQNAIYTVAASFAAGTVFGEGPAGVPIQSFIGTIDPAEIITPLLTQRDGVFDPASLIFVPAGGPTDSI